MKIYKSILFLMFLFLSLIFTQVAYSATMNIVPSKKNISAGEQFYVDLVVDPEGESINLIKGNLSFQNDFISLVRIEEGSSVVNLWIERPTIDSSKSTVNFTGAITNGFNGLIDPFNPNYKMPGVVLRIVFEAQKHGRVNFSTLPFYLNLNDGIGTEMVIPPVFNFVEIDDFVQNIKYSNNKDSVPEIKADVVKDPNIFDGKNVLIFSATDKGSGIKKVMIKEGMRPWEEIKSPYLLKDQSRHSVITLQATNFYDSSIIVSIDKEPYNIKYFLGIFSLILVFCIFLFVIIRKKYVVKK